MSEISIIIPVYNVEQYLERCLDSVLSQTFDDWEAICVNDGSPDNSLSILDKYASKDSRIRIISQKNQGLSMARNNGLKEVQGKYVCFLDSDDFIDKNFLLDLYNEAIKTNADVVMTSTKYVTERNSSQDSLKNNVLTSFAQKISVLPHGSCCNKLYKQAFLLNNKLQFPKGLYWEDNVFTIQVCYFSNQLAVINGNNNSYNYVSNPNGITSNSLKEEKRREDSLAIFKMLMNFAKQQHCNFKELEAVSSFCLRHFINPEHLLQKDFYNEVKEIIGDEKLLKKQRKKTIRRMTKQKRRMTKQKIINSLKQILKYIKIGRPVNE